MDGAAELTGRAVQEIGAASGFDERVLQFEEQLMEIDNLLNDFNRDLAGYMEDADFDEELFY